MARLTSSEKEKIIKRLEKGDSASAIAEDFGISVSAVYYVKKTLGRKAAQLDDEQEEESEVEESEDLDEEESEIDDEEEEEDEAPEPQSAAYWKKKAAQWKAKYLETWGDLIEMGMD